MASLHHYTNLFFYDYTISFLTPLALQTTMRVETMPSAETNLTKNEIIAGHHGSLRDGVEIRRIV
jgi:hypothetical protein